MVWQFIEARDHRSHAASQPLARAAMVARLMVWSSRLGDGWIWYTVGITVVVVFGGDLRFIAFAASASA